MPIPRVSILLPAFNAAATLPMCLASIARQTEPAWDCVIVDDGSADDTLAIARAAAARDPRFRVVPQAHAGLIAALNEGLRHCRAPIVARMDADDAMHRARLARQLRALEEHPEWSAVGSHVRICPRASMSPRLRESERWLNSLHTADDVSRDLFVECPIAHPALMMRRDIADLGYRDHGWPEDYDLILRAAAARLRMGIVPRRLLLWRDRRDGLSRSDARYGLDRFTACKAHFLASGFLRGVDRYILWGYGDTGNAMRRALLDHGRTPSHIVEIKQSRIGQRIHGAPVVSPAAVRSIATPRIVVCVARAGPRSDVRATLAALGFVELEHYICAA